MMRVKQKQISVRITAAEDAWLERRAGKTGNKALVIRELIEREIRRARKQNVLAMFNDAASDLTQADRADGDASLGAFAGLD